MSGLSDKSCGQDSSPLEDGSIKAAVSIGQCLAPVTTAKRNLKQREANTVTLCDAAVIEIVQENVSDTRKSCRDGAALHCET